MIVLIASISVLVSYFVTQSILGSPSNQTAEVETIKEIDATIVAPDTAVFNQDAINPAVEVQISNNSSE